MRIWIYIFLHVSKILFFLSPCLYLFIFVSSSALSSLQLQPVFLVKLFACHSRFFLLPYFLLRVMAEFSSPTFHSLCLYLCFYLCLFLFFVCLLLNSLSLCVQIFFFSIFTSSYNSFTLAHVLSSWSIKSLSLPLSLSFSRYIPLSLTLSPSLPFTLERLASSLTLSTFAVLPSLSKSNFQITPQIFSKHTPNQTYTHTRYHTHTYIQI